MVKEKEIKIDDLEKVSGGGAYAHGIIWKYDIGKHVEIDTAWFFHQFTDGGTIRHRGIITVAGEGNFPGYYVDGDSAGWYIEDKFDDDYRYTERDVVFWVD